MTDVWDLTDKEQGDHVLIALTPDECRSVVDALTRRPADKAGWTARTEVIRCLRDQKGIEA